MSVANSLYWLYLYTDTLKETTDNEILVVIGLINIILANLSTKQFSVMHSLESD